MIKVGELNGFINKIPNQISKKKDYFTKNKSWFLTDLLQFFTVSLLLISFVYAEMFLILTNKKYT